MNARAARAPATVAVPITALAQLFDIGNYSGAPMYDGTNLSALDLARNVIRHAAKELQVIGDATDSGGTLTGEDICSHCWRVSLQLEAALEIVDAMSSSEARQ